MTRIEKALDVIAQIKAPVIAGTSICGTIIASNLGGIDKLLETLFFFMFVDIVLGISIAVVKKRSPKSLSGKVNSTPFFVGLVKKFGVIMLVAFANSIDKALGVDYIRNLTIFAFMAQEGLSIVENAILLGIKVPDSIKNGLDIIDKSKDNQKHR